MKALELAGRFDDHVKNLEAVPGFENIDFVVRDRDCFLQAAAELRRLAAVAAECDALKAERDELRATEAAWRKLNDTLLHQVLCCGVAASHPDATLTTRGEYAGKWNSKQAEAVRALRADRDSLRAELERIQALEPVMIYHGACTIDCGEHGHHDTEMLKMIPAGTKLYALGSKT